MEEAKIPELLNSTASDNQKLEFTPSQIEYLRILSENQILVT